LVDDEDFAGTLTEAAGEPALIQTVDADSFANARIVFFAGEPESMVKFADAALSVGATLIDMSGVLSSRPGVRMWIPSLDPNLPTSAAIPATDTHAFSLPSAPVIISCALSIALKEWSAETISIVFMQPASEHGQQGIEELEHQTTKLLSFQPYGQDVFGMQVAFNLSDRYGEGSRASLQSVRSALARDVAHYLSGRAAAPAVEVLQAPTFHSHGFSAYASLKNPTDTDAIQKALTGSGFSIAAKKEGASNVSVAGEDRPLIGRIERDANHERGIWFWGTVDGLRVGALNAVAIAEHILKAQE
jgi:aspartate-semialdehyde dehydrogenase